MKCSQRCWTGFYLFGDDLRAVRLLPPSEAPRDRVVNCGPSRICCPGWTVKLALRLHDRSGREQVARLAFLPSLLHMASLTLTSNFTKVAKGKAHDVNGTGDRQGRGDITSVSNWVNLSWWKQGSAAAPRASGTGSRLPSAVETSEETPFCSRGTN